MCKCSVPGCDNPVQAQGLCYKHYQRLRRTGTVEKIKEVKVCSVPGCNNKVHARGLCNKHYVRALRESRGI